MTEDTEEKTAPGGVSVLVLDTAEVMVVFMAEGSVRLQAELTPDESIRLSHALHSAGQLAKAMKENPHDHQGSPSRH